MLGKMNPTNLISRGCSHKKVLESRYIKGLLWLNEGRILMAHDRDYGL